LLEKAAQEHHFDPGEAFVIGDKLIDIELGQRVGATTLLVRTGYGAQVAAQAAAQMAITWDHVVDNLANAAAIIERLLNTDKRRCLV
jgi:D-glycero-D-manno-heptose 1,7-bisphosphate phosphatase